jgi:methyl-accepting chemotaxis protein
MLSNFKITHKIYAMCAIQMLLICCIGWVGLSQMSKIGARLTIVTNDDIPLSNSISLLTEHKLEQAILFEKMLLEGVLASQYHIGAQEEFEHINKELLTLTHTIEKEIIDTEVFIENAIPHLHSKAEIDEYQRLLTALEEIKSSYLVLEDEIQHVIDLLKAGDIEDALVEYKTIEAHELELDTQLKDTLHEIQNFTLHSSQQAIADEVNGMKIIATILGVALIVSIILSVLVGKAISKPIKKLNRRIKEISHGDGDLTLRLDDSGTDEISDTAKSFNEFMEQLASTIRFINTSAEGLGTSSSSAIKVMEQTLSHVQTQQDETLMVSSAMEEMRTATQHVAKNTAEAAKVAESARSRVGEGKVAAIDTQEIIKQLASEMNNASSVIESLAEETNNIGNVLEAIRGIAEQTNLLALNAAIEAARAGDTGRGFAVVADEVRSLAQRTQSSTGDIQTLVESLQAEAKNAVLSMQKGSASTEMCLDKSNETAEALEDASQAVNSISDLNTQIASTAEEQSAAAEQIKDNVNNISTIVDEASKGAVDTATANQKIAQDVIELQGSLKQFKV